MAQRSQNQRPRKMYQKAIAKKRKFVKQGIFYAELNDFLGKELAEEGYAGCEVRVTPQRTEVYILSTQSSKVIGDNRRRIRELTALVQKRFKFPKPQQNQGGRKTGLMLYSDRVRNKGFSALAQAQAVKEKLLSGLTVRRAAYSVLKFIMDGEKPGQQQGDKRGKKAALGCEIIVSGKLRGQRAKGMKFRDGFMIHAGDAANYYIDTAVKHVNLPQGVIGIKVKIMLPYDPHGKEGVNFELPDKVTINEPEEKIVKQVNDFDVYGQAQQQQDQQPQQPPEEPQPPPQPIPPPQPQQPPVDPYAQQAPQDDMQGGQQQQSNIMDQSQSQQQSSQQQQPSQQQQMPQYGMPPPQQQQQQSQQSQQQQYGQQQDFSGGYGQAQQQQQQEQFDQYGQGPPPQQQQQSQQQQQPQYQQQYDNQYGQPMQQQQYGQPQQQQYGGQQQQFGQQQQYFDQNRQNNNYQNY